MKAPSKEGCSLELSLHSSPLLGLSWSALPSCFCELRQVREGYYGAKTRFSGVSSLVHLSFPLRGGYSLGHIGGEKQVQKDLHSSIWFTNCPTDINIKGNKYNF